MYVDDKSMQSFNSSLGLFFFKVQAPDSGSLPRQSQVTSHGWMHQCLSWFSCFAGSTVEEMKVLQVEPLFGVS